MLCFMHYVQMLTPECLILTNYNINTIKFFLCINPYFIADTMKEKTKFIPKQKGCNKK